MRKKIKGCKTKIKNKIIECKTEVINDIEECKTKKINKLSELDWNICVVILRKRPQKAKS